MNLINHWTQVAEQQWAVAGFTGTVTFDPVAPPNYKIKWQSLAAGSTVACTSGIVVRDQAP